MGVRADVVVDSPLPVDLSATLSVLRHGGRFDPCYRADRGTFWWATRLPSGPATLCLRSTDRHRVAVSAWGAGAGEAIERAPALVGALDDDGGLSTCDSPVVRRLARELDGLRYGRTGNVMEALVPAIIHQKVTTQGAARSFRSMVRAARCPAPAPSGPLAAGAPSLLLPPTAEWLVSQPSWAWHEWGIEGRRAATIVTAAACAARVEETAVMTPADAAVRLGALPGVGVWTLSNVTTAAHGDPDAVGVGDFWLCHIVVHALTGRPRGSDEEMLELLESWPGQRGRVCRLLRAGGPKLPRFGPRIAVPDIRRL